MPAFARRLIPACLFLSLFVLSSNAAASSVWVTSVAHDCATAPDDTVYIDVMLKDSASPIADGVIFVSRSDNDLNFVSGARGELLAGWTGFSATKRPLGGGVEITISNATPIPAGTTGRLVRLKYLFNCCSGLYNSPHHEPIYVSGTGDFATTSFVDGQSVCMMRNPGTLSVSSGQVTCDGDSVVVRVAVKMQQSPVPVDDGGLGVYVFGANAAINPRSNQIAVENYPGEVTIYDLNTGNSQARLRFKTGAAFTRFSLDGKKLLVLTAGQVAYAFDTDKLGVK